MRRLEALLVDLDGVLRRWPAAVGAAERDPSRCLFVDDTEGHVRAARALGLAAARVEDAQGVRRAIAAFEADRDAAAIVDGTASEPRSRA